MKILRVGSFRRYHPNPYKPTIELVCSECGHEWETECYEESGMCEIPDRAQGVCPECGGEPEE